MIIEEIDVSNTTTSAVCPRCQYEVVGIPDFPLTRLSQLTETLIVVSYSCSHCGLLWRENGRIAITCIRQALIGENNGNPSR